jgi:tetratricopeptide (TPR) repeat protein
VDARALFDQGVKAAKAGQKDEAKKLLQQSLRLDPTNINGWLFLASVISDKKERLLCLQKALLIDPANEMARKAVTALGVDPEALLKVASPPPTPASKPFTDSLPPVEDKTDVPRYLPIEDAPAPQQKPFTGTLPTPKAPEQQPEIPAYLDPSPPAAKPTRPEIPSYLPLDDFEDDEDDPFSEAPPAVKSVTRSEVPSYLPFDDFEDDDADADPFDDDPFGDDVNTVTFADPDDVFADQDDDPFTPAPQSAPTAPANAPQPRSGLPRPPVADQSAGGVPIPDVAYLERVLVYIEPIKAAAQTAPEGPIQWVHKERRRAGERDILTLRLQIGTAILTSLIVLGVIGYTIAWNVPEVRRVVFAATRTPTFTPTRTPTFTPGFSATPSPTLDTTLNPTFTPSPTVPLTFTPIGNINRTPRPTDLYLPQPPGQALINAERAIIFGNPTAVLPTVQAERRLNDTVFNPNNYYYEARLLALAGEFDEAIALMEEAEEALTTRTSASDVVRFRPIIDLGFAEVYVLQGLDALQRGNPGGARASFSNAEPRLTSAITTDPRMARAYILLAEINTLLQNFTDAILVLEQGQAVPDLVDDTSLIIEKGQVYFVQAQLLADQGNQAGARGAFERADYQGFLALYLNPYDEAAHELRIRSALETDRPGLAVSYTETYLLYHPGSPRAFRLMGDARIAEGKPELALSAYANAVQDTADVEAVIATLLARAELYIEQRQFDLALDDYNRALEINPEALNVRAARMQLAYQLGDLAMAAEDAEQVIGSGLVSDDLARLILARSVIDQAQSAEDYEEGLALLNRVNDGGLSTTDAAFANEYRARALYETDNFDAALDAINRAISLSETGSRRYLRGLIQEERGELIAAQSDYAWVVTWDSIFAYPFGDEANGRLIDIGDEIERVSRLTPTVTPTP